MLQKLPAGRDGLLWMASFRDEMVCVLAPSNKTEQYLSQLTKTLQANGRPDAMAQGVVSRLSSGTLVLSVSEDLDVAQQLYVKLCQEEGNEMLPDLAVVLMNGPQIADSIRVDNLIDELNAIAQIQDGVPGVFCILAVKDAAPKLLVDVDIDTLKVRAEQATATNTQPLRMVRGQIRRIEGKGLMMRSKQPIEQVETLVNHFVDAHTHSWPTVESLRTVRYSQAS